MRTLEVGVQAGGLEVSGNLGLPDDAAGIVVSRRSEGPSRNTTGMPRRVSR